MTEPNPLALFEVPLEFGPLDAVLFGKEAYRVIKQAGDHLSIESKAYSWKQLKISRNELQAQLDARTASIIPAYFDLAFGHPPKTSAFSFLAAYPPDVQRQIIVDFVCVNAIWNSRQKNGTPALTARGLDQFYAENRTALETEIDRILGDPKPIGSRKSRVRTTHHFLQPTQMKEKYRAFEASGRNPLAVKNRFDNSIFGGRKLAPEGKAIVVRVAREYATERTPTYVGLHKKVKRTIHELNQHRAPDNRITCPSPNAVTRAAKKLPVGQVIHAKRGNSAMQQEVGLVGDAPKYTRVGEHVEQDCWEIHLFTVLSQIAGGTKNIPDQVKKDLRAVRLYISVVLCRATGCVLGVAFGFTENAAITSAALRLSISDKTAIAEYCGSKAGWPMRARPESLTVDSGQAFRGKEYSTPALSLCSVQTFHVAGLPRLKGAVERLWETADDDFTPHFTGRTKTGPADLGDIDPVVRASLAVEDACKNIIRWFLDVYHLSQHGGLGGQSPARRYQDAVRIGQRPLPSPDEERVIFGHRKTSTIGREGIRYMNVWYKETPLSKPLFNRGPHKAELIVDYENIGCISALIGNEWITIPGPRELQGLRLEDWVRHNQELALRYGAEAEVDYPMVAAALKHFDETSAQALLVAGLNADPLTDEKVDALEKSLGIRVIYNPDPAEFSTSIRPTDGTVGSMHTAGNRQLPSNEAPDDNQAIDPENDDAAPSDEWKFGDGNDD
jgi:putative transposase